MHTLGWRASCSVLVSGGDGFRHTFSGCSEGSQQGLGSSVDVLVVIGSLDVDLYYCDCLVESGVWGRAGGMQVYSWRVRLQVSVVVQTAKENRAS